MSDLYWRTNEQMALQPSLEEDAGEDLRAELRKLIERVNFIPLDGLGKFKLRVHGSLAVLPGPIGTQTAKAPAA